MLLSMGSQRVEHHLAAEQQRTTASIPGFPGPRQAIPTRCSTAILSLFRELSAELSWEGVDPRTGRRPFVPIGASLVVGSPTALPYILLVTGKLCITSDFFAGMSQSTEKTVGAQTMDGLPRWLSRKESACPCRSCGLIPGSGNSPGEGNGYPVQYSCLENSTDRGAWRATVHEVAESRTRLSD